MRIRIFEKSASVDVVQSFAEQTDFLGFSIQNSARREGRKLPKIMLNPQTFHQLLVLMWKAYPVVLVAKFLTFLELQAIKFENVNFHTEMNHSP